MAARQLVTYFLIIIIEHTKLMSVHFKLPEIKNDFDMKSHLKFQNVWEYCANRDTACASNNTNVCAVNMKNNKKIYKDFKNGCYLFLSNMCDHPGEEYFIANSGNCEEYLATRRGEDDSETSTPGDSETINNSTENMDSMDNAVNQTEYGANDSGTDHTVSDAALRQAKRFSRLYSISESYDYHPCPYSCPNVYEPVCLNVNRGFGKYYKMFTFINHCASDMYYCKNFKEFKPPPDEKEEKIRFSYLSWSFCAASRYIQFARFSEYTSSMSHYGWLKGDNRYSQILEPHERAPGYG